MRDQPGRPPKSDGPAIPHDEVDHLLVHGEVVEEEDGVGTRVHYPSYRQLADRYGVAHSLIAKFAKEHNCLTRRKQAQKRVREMADVKLAEMRADDIAISRDDIIRCIDRYIAKFEEALKEGRVRCDNPSDYNTMIRLRAFAMGDPDSRHEELGITLEDMQRGHARLLEVEEQIRKNPAITGMAVPTPAMLDADDDDDGGDGGGSPQLN
ncbi:MAG: hypothetical protein JW990_20460 [Thermoleophilia bacterium]|nr:hypothetical protein [Thermoleophilia bacterium]